MTENKVELWVDGQIHEGWTSVGCALNLDHLSGAFTLAVTEDWHAAGQLVRLAINPGAACALKIDGETVITGWVDAVAPSYDAGRHEISVSGRDKAGDLIDCSAQITEFHGQKLEAIAAALAKPFGVTVTAQADTGPAFSRFAVNPGDTVGQCIERLVRQRGVLAWSDGLGGLVIGRGQTGKPVAALVRGENILSANARLSFEERFSTITVKGAREGGDEDEDGEQIVHGQGVAVDPAVKRHRPLILTPETQGNGPTMSERAAWEMRVRAGRSKSITAKVQGWRHAGGLWRPGQTVTFNDDWLRASGDWLLSNVLLEKSEGGGVATLTLAPPGAFDRLAEPEKTETEDGEDW